LNAGDKKVKWKIAPYREKISTAMQMYESQKYMLQTQAFYQSYLTMVTQFLVKIKPDEIGKYPWS
jgi:hypothetical protein